jgi:sterol desaturase/sphingolipid hydroxylase (fatty acid hydroxylase superfamily)
MSAIATPAAPLAIARRLGRIALTVALVAAATWLWLTALAVARALHADAPLGAALLMQPPWDPLVLALLAMFAGVMLVEWWEHGWAGHKLRRLLMEDHPTDRADIFYFAGDLTGLSSILMLLASCGLSGAIETVAGSGGTRLVAEWPIWIAVPVLFVLTDFTQYWGHRLVHTRLLWPLHAVHHAAEAMSALTTSRHHPLDSFAGVLWVAVPAGLAGFSPDALLVVSLLIAMQTILGHTTITMPRWFDRHFNGPRAHHIHHATDPACHDTNFAGLVIWDRMFGTRLMREDALSLPTGVAQPGLNTGNPLRDLATATRLLGDNLAGACGTLQGGRSRAAQHGATG